MAPLLLRTFLFLFPAVAILWEKAFAASSGRSTHLELRQQPEATCARCALPVLQEGRSQWRHRAETWRSKVNCQPHSQSCVWSCGLCSSVSLTEASVLLLPLTDATGSKPRNFSEGDSRGNYSCHPKLVIYLFTQAETFWEMLAPAAFCFQALCVSLPTPSLWVLQRKGRLLSLSLAFGRVFLFESGGSMFVISGISNPGNNGVLCEFSCNELSSNRFSSA